MSEKGLQILAKKSLIPFAKGMSLNPCDFCFFGKQHRVSFNILSTSLRGKKFSFQQIRFILG